MGEHDRVMLLRVYLVCIATALTLGLFVSGCTSTGPSELGAPGQQESAEFEMPVELRNANEVGSVQFELMYDPDVLKLLEVVTATAPSTTMIDSNTDSAGRAIIGIVDEGGIDGEALSLSMRFGILQKGAGCSLTIENVVAYDAATISPVSSSPTLGEFRGDAWSLTPPVLVFTP